MSISPNYSQTVGFLELFRPQGPHLLTAIPVEKGRPTTERFSSTVGIEEWCKEYNTGHGLYYHVGIPHEGIARRMSKPCVASLDHLWVDIDPTDKVSRKDIIEKLTAAPPEGVPKRPTIIVDSGGGFQALWRLSSPIELPNADAWAEAERLTRHLVTAYEGDQQAWEVARLLRLPGTINYPDETKRKKGRVTALAKFKLIEDGALDQIGFAKAPPHKRSNKDFSPSVMVKDRYLAYDASSLPEGLGEKWTDIIVHGEESWHYEDVGYVSRSEMVMGATRFMLERGMEHQMVYDILLSSDLAISNHIYAQKDVHRYGKRQIEQCLKSMKLSSDKPAEKAEELSFIYDQPAKKGGVPHIINVLLHNAIVAVYKLGVTCVYNELTDIMLLNGEPFEDHLVTKIRSEIEDKYKVTFAQKMMKEVLLHLCHENVVNPVLEYLDNLPKWDGEKRLSNWLMDYCGAEGTKFNRAVGRIVLIAAVRRMRHPGCKFDEMLILEGEQGDGKSNLLGKGLVPNPEWFSDHLTMDRGAKEFIEDTFGHWIVECSELVTMRQAQIDSLKALLSRGVDKARMAYARSRLDRARRFIIIGSTNQQQYLIDDTGNRRFWPVATSGNLNKKVKLLSQNRNQIWAEAAAAEAGTAHVRPESIRLAPNLYAEAKREQVMRQIDNPLVDAISRAVGSADGLVKSLDVLNFIGIGIKDHHKNFRKLGEAMRALDFEHKQMRRDGVNSKFWQRGENNPKKDIVLKYEHEEY